jgi:hypothetical protein
MSVQQVIPVLTAAVLASLFHGCFSRGDAASRLAEEINYQASLLRINESGRSSFAYQPAEEPGGCRDAVEVALQMSASLPQPSGALVVGCVAESNDGGAKRSYSTTNHLKTVRVPRALSFRYKKGQPVQVTLMKTHEHVFVTALE